MSPIGTRAKEDSKKTIRPGSAVPHGRNKNRVLWRREYTKKSGNRIVVSTRKNICKKSA